VVECDEEGLLDDVVHLGVPAHEAPGETAQPLSCAARSSASGRVGAVTTGPPSWSGRRTGIGVPAGGIPTIPTSTVDTLGREAENATSLHPDRGRLMIFKKVWRAIKAQVNKLANFFWTADPIAQMQYEYDLAVEQLKEGRQGLEQYRALVERVSRQVSLEAKEEAKLSAKIKAYLQAGDRETAARLALELQKVRGELEENRQQLALHETAYENNLKKIKSAGQKLAKVREKIQKYDAELKMSRAEAEIAKLNESFHFNVTTDFGQIEQVIQQQIDLNRAKVRVSADMSSQGIEQIEREEAMERVMAEQALREFEVDMGLITPETSEALDAPKALGRATTKETE
jgi:phage shock protein A